MVDWPCHQGTTALCCLATTTVAMNIVQLALCGGVWWSVLCVVVSVVYGGQCCVLTGVTGIAAI